MGQGFAVGARCPSIRREPGGDELLSKYSENACMHARKEFPKNWKCSLSVVSPLVRERGGQEGVARNVFGGPDLLPERLTRGCWALCPRGRAHLIMGVDHVVCREVSLGGAWWRGHTHGQACMHACTHVYTLTLQCVVWKEASI